MSTIFSLDEWFAIVERGTSGDQVYDILYSWKAERDTTHKQLDILKQAILDNKDDLIFPKEWCDNALAAIERIGKDE